MSEIGEIPLEVLRSKVVKVEPDIFSAGFAEEEVQEQAVEILKRTALNYAEAYRPESWFTDSIKNSRFLEGIVSHMRHIDHGQEFILKELEKISPEMNWYRGGTLQKFRDGFGPSIAEHYTQEQLDTYVIDGGKNGVLGRPSTALNFLRLSPRQNPVFYTVPISGLISGLESRSIRLDSEHEYDLCINAGKDWNEYLNFCRGSLQIQSVIMPQE